MSFTELLTRTAIVHRKIPTATPGDYNAPTFIESTFTEPCYLEQIERSEDATGRDTSVGTHRAFFDPDVTLSPIDTVVIDGTTYDVVGTPDVAFSGRTGVPHHLEATLVEAE